MLGLKEIKMDKLTVNDLVWFIRDVDSKIKQMGGKRDYDISLVLYKEGYKFDIRISERDYLNIEDSV